ncbi:MAG: 30S ribosomal protein S13 [Candidatus Aenigmarchaeota archaeon]|nr:30S ribosomal protein S13 [Candidatus Aenigmarchaeota archaeon]
MTEQKTEPRRVVRFFSRDIDGRLPVRRALMKVKGIGHMFSNAICVSTGVDSNKQLGMLNLEEIKILEEAVSTASAKVPRWMLNRRYDLESGIDSHMTGSQLDLRVREDINIMKRSRAYKGVRHELGQPVRGQRTRSTFRTQKSVGVSKKKTLAARKAMPEKK